MAILACWLAIFSLYNVLSFQCQYEMVNFILNCSFMKEFPSICSKLLSGVECVDMCANSYVALSLFSLDCTSYNLWLGRLWYFSWKTHCEVCIRIASITEVAVRKESVDHESIG